MVCWPRLQHGHAPCTVRTIHAAMGVVIVFPAFCSFVAPVRQTVSRRCVLLIVFDLYELFLTRILITRYYYYYYMTVW